VLLARRQGMGGESSDDWRSVLDDLIGREPPQPSASLTPHPTMRVRDYIRGANPAGSGRQQSYRCTINMYLIRMSWLRGKTGRDQSRSRGAEKTAIIRPNFGVHSGKPGFPLALC
jgi:hypothetical protein